MTKPNEEIKYRLRKALNLRNTKPVELSEKTNIPKSAISQYMSGYAKPKQDRIYLISKALDISEAWLMGFDVPIARKTQKDLSDEKISNKEILLLKKYNKLNDLGKHKAEDYIEDLTRMDIYCNSKNEYNVVAAHNDNLNNKDNKDELDLIEEDLNDMDKW